MSGSCGSGLAIKWPLQICESSASLLTPTSKSCIFNSRSIPDLGLSNELDCSGVTEKAFGQCFRSVGKNAALLTLNEIAPKHHPPSHQKEEGASWFDRPRKSSI